MTNDAVLNDYFDWLSDIVCGIKFSPDISYKKLLMHLHNTEFKYSIPKDDNRADDGINLRYRFSGHLWPGPCSVLEMMIALILRFENDLTDDPKIGDRTREWFWKMIKSLGLNEMTDDRYDRKYVDFVMDRFINRDYEPNGEGGLFTIKNCEYDLRNVEIWYQLCWYLDSII